MPAFAVVVVEAPTNTVDRVQGGWPAFANATAKIVAHNSKDLQPSENIWLIPLPNETPVLACVVAAAIQYSIQYRVLYFDTAPQEFS